MGFKIRGISETINNLDLTSKKVNQGANEVLRRGAFIVKRVIEVKTPLGPGKLYGHAKHQVRTTGVGTNGGTGGKSIKIGYDPSVAWRMYFVEEGTYSKGNPKGIRPRKIVASSLSEAEQEVNRVMADAVRELFGG